VGQILRMMIESLYSLSLDINVHLKKKGIFVDVILHMNKNAETN